MKEQQRWDLGPGLRVVGTQHLPDRWVVMAELAGQTGCPDCGLRSACRQSTYVRRLQDLPVQGKAVEVHLRTTRWRCRNPSCRRKTFAGRSAPAAPAYARQTDRAAELVRLVGDTAGGRPAERLLRRFGKPQGDDRILKPPQAPRRRGPIRPQPITIHRPAERGRRCYEPASVCREASGASRLPPRSGVQATGSLPRQRNRAKPSAVHYPPASA